MARCCAVHVVMVMALSTPGAIMGHMQGEAES